MILRRQTSFRFTFSAVLTLPETERGEAGMTCYYDENSFLTLGLRREDGLWRVRVTEQIGHETKLRVDERITELRPGQRVKLEARADGLRRELSWTLKGRELAEINHGVVQECAESCESITLDNVTYLSDEGVKLGKRFTGAMVGVYALDGVEADFDSLTYREE